MKLYPSYKDSGVEWIGEIPKEWNFIPLKNLCYMKGRIGWRGLKQEEFMDEGPYLITGHDIKNDKIDWSKCYRISNDRYFESPEIMVKNDDLLFTKDGTIGKTLYISELLGPTTLNSHLLLIRPIKGRYHSKFLEYVFKSLYFLIYVDLSKTGTTFFGVSQYTMENFRGLFPHLQEQQQISNYLDQKTKQIDDLIEKTEQKIELLKEKRTSLINHCVTKGLDPNVEMKDSGVEWIGDIPKEWDVGKLNHVTSKMTNGFVGSTRGVMRDHGIRYIQGIHIKRGEILYTPKGHYYVSEEWSNEHKKSILREGDVLVVQTGTIGEVGYVTKEFENCNCHALIIVRMKKEFGIGRYLMYFIMSNYVRSYFQTIKTGEILQHLNVTKVQYMNICIPPLQEQQQLVTHLDQETKKIDTLIEKENKQIELLKEYRQSLISEVVTGKIDVRNEVLQ